MLLDKTGQTKMWKVRLRRGGGGGGGGGRRQPGAKGGGGGGGGGDEPFWPSDKASGW